MTAEDGPAGPHRRHPTIAVSAVNIAAGLATGWVVFVLSRPSQDELQQAVLDEIGLPVELEAAPVLGPALDAYTERVAARVVAESKASAAAALGAGVVVTVGCSVAVSAVAGRAGRRAATGRGDVVLGGAEEEAE